MKVGYAVDVFDTLIAMAAVGQVVFALNHEVAFHLDGLFLSDLGEMVVIARNETIVTVPTEAIETILEKAVASQAGV